MTNREIEKLLEDTAAKLGEHFDGVQILVSWNELGLTKNCFKGSGNWFTRQGMAHQFITEDIAQDNARAIAFRLNPPPEETV